MKCSFERRLGIVNATNQGSSKIRLKGAGPAPTQDDSNYTVSCSLITSPNIKINREVTQIITELLKMKCNREELVELIQAGGKIIQFPQWMGTISWKIKRQDPITDTHKKIYPQTFIK